MVCRDLSTKGTSVKRDDKVFKILRVEVRNIKRRVETLETDKANQASELSNLSNDQSANALKKTTTRFNKQIAELGRKIDDISSFCVEQIAEVCKKYETQCAMLMERNELLTGSYCAAVKEIDYLKNELSMQKNQQKAYFTNMQLSLRNQQEEQIRMNREQLENIRKESNIAVVELKDNVYYHLHRLETKTQRDIVDIKQDQCQSRNTLLEIQQMLLYPTRDRDERRIHRNRRSRSRSPSRSRERRPFRPLERRREVRIVWDHVVSCM